MISVFAAIAGHERDVEIVISDNASPDNTRNVILEFQVAHPSIRYHRNAQNIGIRNFYLLAALAQGENIWIFGDDDKMEANAVSVVLDHLRAGYDLIICNYTFWDRQFYKMRRKMRGISGRKDQIFEDANELMKRFGLHLGYISSIVIKRSLFLKPPASEYEVFLEYGFPHLYSIYAGIVNCVCKTGFIAAPLVRNRGGNSGNYDWYKFFVVGSSLIFDKLQTKGYAKNAVFSAKNQVLRRFVIPNLLRRKALDHDDKINMTLVHRHYKRNWLFWVIYVPVFLIPRFLVRFAIKIFFNLRKA